MSTGIATPGFLKDLRVECRKIDRYLLDHGFKEDGAKEVIEEESSVRSVPLHLQT